MKKNIVAIIVFIFILVFPMVVNPLVAPYEPFISENRNLAAAPNLGDDNFIRQADNWFSDHAPLRHTMISVQNGIKIFFQNIYSKLMEWFNIPYYKSLNNVLFGDEDWLFFLGDNSLDYYKRTNLPSEEELASYVESAEKVRDYFEAQGKDFIIIICPNKEQVYSEYMPSSISVKNELLRLETIYNYFKQHSTVRMYYPLKEILDAKKFGDLYYKQDTHWTTAGAFFGLQPIFETLGFDSIPYQITLIKHTGGDLANMIAAQPMEYEHASVVYKPYINVEYNTENYTTFATSDNNNGKELLFLGDSFSENIKPIISKEYNYSKFIKIADITFDKFQTECFSNADTIILERVERFDRTIFGSEGILEKIIKKYGL